MARILLVSASMGSGHDGVAKELARRLRALGHEAHVVDLLSLYPCGLGRVMRAGYAAMLWLAPWLYELIYQVFFVPGRCPAPGVSPAVLLPQRRLRRVVRRQRPDAVVSTFHLAGQVVGRMRRRGELSAGSIVVVTEASAHSLWRAAGTDLYLCAYPQQAALLRRELGVDARAPGPVVHPRFRAAAAGNAPAGVTPVAVPAVPTAPVPAVRTGTTPAGRSVDDRPIVLLSSGSWGVGHPERVAAAVAATGRYRLLVLCGRSKVCQRRMRDQAGLAVGWVPDLLPLLTSAAVLIENSGGGLTSWEAFAVGLPVVTFAPIAGHGRDGARRLNCSGLVLSPGDDHALVDALDDLTAPGSPTRERLRHATAALFERDCARVISDWVLDQERVPGH